MKKIIAFIFICIYFSITNLNAQTDSTALLPDKYLFTQKLLWSERGLMRNIDYFKLTPESREREINIRYRLIQTHQILGYTALGLMAFQGVVGSQLYKGDYSVYSLHETLASSINICYFSSAGLIFFAPPPLHDRPSGVSKVKLHRILSAIHLTSMITTNILSEMLVSNSELRPYHRAAAYSAFGSLMASMIIIKL